MDLGGTRYLENKGNIRSREGIGTYEGNCTYRDVICLLGRTEAAGWIIRRERIPGGAPDQQPAAIEHETTLPVPANDATGGDAR